jgi:hypothetical protein
MIETPCLIVRQKEIFGKKAGHGQVSCGASAESISDSSQESYQFNNCLTDAPCAMCSDARRQCAKSSEPTPPTNRS